jgi:Elongation factor G, domain IV
MIRNCQSIRNRDANRGRDDRSGWLFNYPAPIRAQLAVEGPGKPMETRAQTFPPVPIRGVHAAYSFYTGCPHHFASVTVDFEPWEDGFTVEFADDAVVESSPIFEELPMLQAALTEGMREQLGQVPETGIAVAVVVQRMVITHDSYAKSFRMVGRFAVREALERAYSKPPKRKHRR